jgi:hypothetical protein
VDKDIEAARDARCARRDLVGHGVAPRRIFDGSLGRGLELAPQVGEAVASLVPFRAGRVWMKRRPPSSESLAIPLA